MRCRWVGRACSFSSDPLHWPSSCGAQSAAARPYFAAVCERALVLEEKKESAPLLVGRARSKWMMNKRKKRERTTRKTTPTLACSGEIKGGRGQQTGQANQAHQASDEGPLCTPKVLAYACHGTRPTLCPSQLPPMDNNYCGITRYLGPYHAVKIIVACVGPLIWSPAALSLFPSYDTHRPHPPPHRAPALLLLLLGHTCRLRFLVFPLSGGLAARNFLALAHCSPSAPCCPFLILPSSTLFPPSHSFTPFLYFPRSFVVASFVYPVLSLFRALLLFSEYLITRAIHFSCSFFRFSPVSLF